MEQTGKAFLRSSRHAALLALCYFAAVMIPNCILFFTEPYSIWSKAALLTLPAEAICCGASHSVVRESPCG